MATQQIESLSDDALALETKRAAGVERASTARLIELLIEIEQRRLHLTLGSSSMFVYCTKALLLSEQAAYSRITAARAVRRYPRMLSMLTDGSLTLSSVGLLAPHLTEENANSLLEGAAGKSSREVERMIANLHQQPDIAASVRALPTRPAPILNAGLLCDAQTTDRKAGPVVAAPSRAVEIRPVIAPLSPKTYLLRVTIGEATQSKLRRLQALLRHSIPNGDPAEVIDRALTMLLDETERRQIAAVETPRRSAGPGSAKGRGIPAATRRAVWKRDAGRCAFVGSDGRCGELGFLEFHHVVPFAAGGPTSIDNLQLRCRAHNQYEAMMYFGEDRDVTAARR